LEMKKTQDYGYGKEHQAPPCCTTAEAARSLGVSLRTVQLWVDSGALQAWKTVGGHRRIPLESLERLRKLTLSQNTTDAGKE